jgi:hypothetical protein
MQRKGEGIIEATRKRVLGRLDVGMGIFSPFILP